MSTRDQQKTQNYKDATKVLKLIIVKRQKTIQQLQLKCKQYEDEIIDLTSKIETPRELINLSSTSPKILKKGMTNILQIREEELANLNGKSKVMKKFLKAAESFGISPESIFRIADVNYTNCIQSDYFRTVLYKMELSLSQRQISCLIFIFDENYQGYITRQDFHNSLHAYQVGVEQKSLHYTQECLLVLCSVFHSQRTDLNKFYDDMKSIAKTKNNGNVDLRIFQEQIKKSFSQKLQERQIVGAFNQINMQKQSSIEKKNFLYGVNSFTNRLLKQQRPRTQIHSQLPMGSSNLKNSRSELRVAPKNINASIISVNNNSNSVYFNKNQTSEQRSIDRILRQKNIHFDDIVTELTHMQIKSRLTMHQFKKCCQKMSKEIASEDVKIIFKTLDINQKGSIHLFDVINLCLSHFKDVNLVFRLIGKTLQILQTTPEQFWCSQGFEDFSRLISKSAFIGIMAKACETKPEQSWQIVWNYFDKGKGSISVQSVVDVWKKYYVQ